MSKGRSRQHASLRCLLWNALFAAALLALGPSSVFAARRAFVGDLESNDAAANAGGRRKLLNSNEIDILDSFEYDILDVVSEEYSPSLDCGYGGYGVYGYYGQLSGVYGTYNGEAFFDELVEFDGLISGELDIEESMHRRAMQAAQIVEAEVDIPVSVEAAIYDYTYVETPALYAVYGGNGAAFLDGTLGLYGFGYYGGEMQLDCESSKRLDDTLIDMTDLVNEVASEQAEEDLLENIATGKISAIVPKLR